MVKQAITVISGLAALVAFTAGAGDPTRPHDWSASQTVATATAEEQLQLTQIIAFADKRYAMINGQRYQLGSRVGGYRIVAIENQRVRLQNAEQELQLSLFSDDIKTRTVTGGEPQ